MLGVDFFLLVYGVWRKKWREGVPTAVGLFNIQLLFSFSVVWYSTLSAILGVVRKVMLEDFPTQAL